MKASECQSSEVREADFVKDLMINLNSIVMEVGIFKANCVIVCCFVECHLCGETLPYHGKTRNFL